VCSVIGVNCKLSCSVLFKFLIILYAFIWRPCQSCSILDTNVSQHCFLIFLVSLFTIATNLLYSILSVSKCVAKYNKYAFFLFSIKFLISSFHRIERLMCLLFFFCLKLHSPLVVMYSLKFAILH